MKVTSVSLYSNELESLRFDLNNVSSKSPYLIRAIVGLDAEELIPKFYGFGLNTNQKFYDMNLSPRDIVLRIVLNPRFNLDESYSSIRDSIYKTISATRTGEIKLQFHSGASNIAEISGFINKLEVPYFSKTPELQLTIRCNDPMFRSVSPVRMEGIDLPNDNHLIFEDVWSTAPHGFTMQLTFTQTLATFTIQDKDTLPEWKFKIIPATSFLAGDILNFSSLTSNKYVSRTRSGVVLNLMDKVEPTSVWPIAFPGINEINFNDFASFDWNFIQFNATFWGV